MGHPDFRVAGKIFATIGYPRTGVAVVMLTPEDQDFFVRAQPGGFAPVKGAWGQRGSTTVVLEAADRGLVRSALRAAWERRASGGPRKPPGSRSGPRRTRRP